MLAKQAACNLSMGACEAEKQTLGGCEGRSINVGGRSIGGDCGIG